jgi:hypothetical protein
MFPFDPAGMSSPDMELKEIKNGRLAMLAFVGFASTAAVNGMGPIESLTAHIADPGHNNSEQRGGGAGAQPPPLLQTTLTCQGVFLLSPSAFPPLSFKTPHTAPPPFPPSRSLLELGRQGDRGDRGRPVRVPCHH